LLVKLGIWKESKESKEFKEFKEFKETTVVERTS